MGLSNILSMEDQLLCGPIQVEAGDAYDDMKNTFESFQKKYR